MSLLNSILHAINWLLGQTLFLLVIALCLYCAYDCYKRRFREPIHKWLWIAAILFLFPPLGAMGYLMFGREQGLRY